MTGKRTRRIILSFSLFSRANTSTLSCRRNQQNFSKKLILISNIHDDEVLVLNSIKEC